MFGLMVQKMRHKKWMTVSLAIGCILLIATAVSFPLYEKAAYNRMLQDEFELILAREGKWPTLMSMSANINKDRNGQIQEAELFFDTVYDELGVGKHQTVFYYVMQRATLVSDMNREDVEGLGVNLAGLSDIENHISLISGEMYGESGLSEDGCIEVIMTEESMISQGLLLGETLTLRGLTDAEGNPIRIKIQGIFRPNSESEVYWQDGEIELTDRLFMNLDLLREMFTGKNATKYTIMCDFYAYMDYTDIHYEDAAPIIERTKYFCEESAFAKMLSYPEYLDTLDTYQRKINRVSTTLLILQIPVMIMLCAFLLMITGQMYEMERNEISVIKSRGSYRTQIFRLYLYQGMVLTALGTVFGVPLGILFSKMLGAARNFLEFDFTNSLTIEFSQKALVYGLVAIGSCLVSLTVPVIKHSKVTIVNLKQSNAQKKKGIWEKLYLDVILLLISLYGYYSFHRSKEGVASSVLQGEGLDPLLYISSSLFLLGMGLLFLRLHPYLIKLIYTMGKPFWKCASYISFQENIKNGRKQQLIMLFLMMTISLGIYHATAARTILANAVENTEYLSGTDVVLKEVWPVNYVSGETTKTKYTEPDDTKYTTLAMSDGMTKVYRFHDSYCEGKKTQRQQITVMGIHTKEFGSLTYVEDEILKKPYYEYLNELAVVPNGVLLSSNFETVLGYKVGDSITFRNAAGQGIKGKIVDFIDYFPGYADTIQEIHPDGTAKKTDQFLLVTHFTLLQNKWETRPYEVWMNLKEDYDSADIKNWIQENEIRLSSYTNKEEELQSTMEDPLLQGTNGVLSMGFMVTLLLCVIGYLIYWILAIRERELMFGVLRASGLHKSEMVQMLIEEQIFCGVFSILVGIGIGKLSAKMFVPILQQAYASENQVLPMKLIMNASDLYRLYFVVIATMLLALGILIAILFHMNVTKALKLGEE